jgi:uncharacterized protein YndB with AHSA1/START domain
MAIRLTRRFRASPQRVFDAWLDPGVAGQWLFATALRPMTKVAIDARVGGAFRLEDRRGGEIVAHDGRYIEIVPHRRLVFELLAGRHPRLPTRVVVEISPLKRGCELRLSHEHVPGDRAHDTEARWSGMLYGLGEMLAARAGQARSR